jgi:methylenetetrahydrofolate reductase (NADPH)
MADRIADTQRVRPDATIETLLATLLSSCSLETTATVRAVAAICDVQLPRGTAIYITALPGNAPDAVIAAAVRLRAVGLEPVPHIAARHYESGEVLDQTLARLTEEAGIRRVLAIGGDVDRPRGPFASSREVIETGLLERHGITHVGIAGYPEGHPRIAPMVLDQELALKIESLRASGLTPHIVTQFCFEAEPIAALIARCAARFPDVPVHVGLAGPAKLSTLLKYAVSCGIGNSLRALRRNASFGKLLTESDPEPILEALVQAAPPIAHLHLFPFGGIERTAEWISVLRE